MDLWSLQQIRQGFKVIDFEAGGDRLVGERKIIKKSEEKTDRGCWENRCLMIVHLRCIMVSHEIFHAKFGDFGLWPMCYVDEKKIEWIRLFQNCECLEWQPRKKKFLGGILCLKISRKNKSGRKNREKMKNRLKIKWFI